MKHFTIELEPQTLRAVFFYQTNLLDENKQLYDTKNKYPVSYNLESTSLGNSYINTDI